jgi:hypothetical protein
LTRGPALAGATAALLVAVILELNVPHVRPLRVVSTVMIVSECNMQPPAVVITFNDGQSIYFDATMPEPPPVLQKQILDLSAEQKHVFIISCPPTGVQNENYNHLQIARLEEARGEWRR